MVDGLVLGDSLEVLIDHRGKTPKKLGSDFVERGVPVASAIMVKDGRLDLSDARYVDDDTFRRWMPERVRGGDVILTSEAPLGRLARVRDSEPLVLGQRLFCLRGLVGVLDSGYLYYALQTEWLQADLVGRSTGTTVVGIRQSALRSLVVPAPSFTEQQAVAEVLGALDDKIVANDQALLKLSQLQVAAFEHAILSGSHAVRVNDAADFHNRRRVPLSSRDRERRPGGIPYYGAAGQLDSVDEALFEGEFVLVGEDGTVVRSDGRPVVQYIWGPSWVNNHAHVLTGKRISTELLKLAIQRESVAHLVTGAVQPKLSMGSLKSLVVSVPVATAELEDFVQAIVAHSRALVDASKVITATRDELLPLLMSGKVRVKDAEKVVEEVV